jgi:hypothetical protein
MLHSLLDVESDSARPEAELVEVGLAEVTDFVLLNAAGSEVNATKTGARLTARMSVKAHRDIDQPFLGLTINGPKGDAIFHQGNQATPFPPLRSGEERVYAVSWNAQVPTGSYAARAFFGKIDHAARVSVLGNATPIAFFVQGKRDTHGVVDVEADFATAD